MLIYKSKLKALFIAFLIISFHHAKSQELVVNGVKKNLVVNKTVIFKYNENETIEGKFNNLSEKKLKIKILPLSHESASGFAYIDCEGNSNSASNSLTLRTKFVKQQQRQQESRQRPNRNRSKSNNSLCYGNFKIKTDGLNCINRILVKIHQGKNLYNAEFRPNMTCD